MSETKGRGGWLDAGEWLLNWHIMLVNYRREARHYMDDDGVARYSAALAELQALARESRE